MIRTRTRDEWAELGGDGDACLTPVLSPAEAPAHPHNRWRGTFVETAGGPRPAPAPRFSRTPCAEPGPPPAPGEHTDEALGAWGFTATELASLRDVGAIG